MLFAVVLRGVIGLEDDVERIFQLILVKVFLDLLHMPCPGLKGDLHLHACPGWSSLKFLQDILDTCDLNTSRW